MATAELVGPDPGPDLSESALDSPLFDQPAPDQAPISYLILSARRSGSYMLCRALIRAGLGVPHEYFMRDHVRALSLRWGVDAGGPRTPVSAAYLRALMDHRTSRGLFGAKLQYWQYERTLRSPQGERLLDGARLIYLYREDVLRQAVSFRHAEITGRWGSGEKVTTRPLVHEDPFDPRGIERKINLLLYDELGWRSFLARRGKRALVLSYEQVCADLPGALGAIALHLEVDRERIARPEPDTPSPLAGADAAMKARMLEAYLDQTARGRGAWAHGPADVIWEAWGRANGLSD